MPSTRTVAKAAPSSSRSATTQQTSLLHFIASAGGKRSRPEGQEGSARKIKMSRGTTATVAASHSPAAARASGVTASDVSPSTTASASPAAVAAPTTPGEPLSRDDRDEGSLSRCISSSDDDCAVGELLGLRLCEAGATSLSAGHPHRDTGNAHPTAQPPTQTFLDFGCDSSPRLANECPHCGMVFTNQQEDLALHRRHCKPLSRHQGGRHLPAQSTDGEPLAQSTEAAAILEALHKGTHKRKGKRANPSTSGACEAVREADLWRQDLSRGPSDALSVVESTLYVLRCGDPAVSQAPDVVRLLESFGFYDAVLEAIDYTVVVVVADTLRRVLAAVAGRPSTREQDPQLIVEHRGDGSTRCGHIKSFTFCDVNYLYLAPEFVFQRAVQAATLSRRSAGVTLTSHKDAVRELFALPSATAARLRAVQQETSERGGYHERSAALRKALAGLGRSVVYGHHLSAESDFSFSATLLLADSQRMQDEAHVTARFLAQSVLADTADIVGNMDKENASAACGRGEEPTGLYFHNSEEDGDEGPLRDRAHRAVVTREDEDEDERIEYLSVISYEDGEA